MTERKKAIGQIKAIAQELINEDGFGFDVFRLTHSSVYCEITQETGLKTRVVELGHSEGYPAKRLVCKKHNKSSEWVHIDY